MIWFIELFGITDPHLQNKVLPGAFGFLGVIITGGVAIAIWALNQWALRRERVNIRSERHRDLKIAIWAEINAIWQFLVNIDPAKKSPNTIRQTFERAAVGKKPHRYTPFIVAPPRSVLFDVVKTDFMLLKEDEIPEITQFYRHLDIIGDFAGDLRGPAYRELALDRKEAMLLHYISQIGLLQSYAEGCLTILENKCLIPRHKKMASIRAGLVSRTDQAQTGPASAG